jgi:hypothetical protein
MRVFTVDAAPWLAAVVVLTAPPVFAGDGTALPAVWKEQHVDFAYVGRTSRYSCDGIRDKLRAILMDLGARRDLRAVAVGCDDFGNHRRPDNANPSVSLVFSAPAVPDPAAKPLHAGDLAALDARYEAFTITSDAFRNMGVGDCELVEEFVRQILPKLATRNVQRDITCIPYQLSGSQYWVRGEVLKPAPKGPAPTSPAKS